MIETISSIFIGNEYDQKIVDAIERALRLPDFRIIRDSGGIAGSQEFRIIEFLFKNEKFKIEFETYIGINLIGKSKNLYRILEIIKEF